jgi:predicted RNA-binding protein with PIN domain
MTSEIIIDAYNLIHRSSDLKKILQTNLEQAREQLLHKLIAFKKGKKIKITVVFDGSQVGQPSNLKRSGLQIHYSVPPRNADEVIKILIQKNKNPRNLTVISSDNEVLGFARTSRANVMKSEDFYKKYLVFEEKFETNKNQQQMTKAELENWLDLFNQEKEK